MSWHVSRDAVPDWHDQWTVRDEVTGERVAIVFDARLATLIGDRPDLVESMLQEANR